MELRDYLRILRRRWLMIVSITLVALTAAALLTYRATPQYTSTARVFISTSPTDGDSAYQGSLFSQQRVSSYADIVNGLELTQRVVNSLNLDMTAEELSSRIKASVVPDTVLLSISMTDPSPELAQRVANAMVSELSSFVKELETPAGADRALIKATVIDSARVPTSPTSPQPTRNLGLALVLGLLVGFGLAVVRELLDTTVKSPDEAAEVADAPVLGGIGEDPEATRTPLVTSLSPHSARVEAFRVLRTNVQFLEVDSHNKVFVVTSAMPAEGKSATATNLALVLAQGGQQVLLIDGDLRRPRVASRMGLEGDVGLTTVLLGKISFADALQREATTGLSVLAGGAVPPNPAELLQSHAMEDLLREAKDRFDVVIIDSPPLLPVTDATLLASRSDGALIVLRHGKTTRDELASAVARLQGVGSHPLGVVLNRIPRKRGSYGYGYGYGYGYAPDSDEADGNHFGRGGKTRSERERSRANRKVAKEQARAERKQAKAGQRRATDVLPEPSAGNDERPVGSHAHRVDEVPQESSFLLETFRTEAPEDLRFDALESQPSRATEPQAVSEQAFVESSGLHDHRPRMNARPATPRMKSRARVLRRRKRDERP